MKKRYLALIVRVLLIALLAECTISNAQTKSAGGAPDDRKTIEDWRRRIDQIDLELVKLLNERTNCAIEIGHLKKRQGLQISVPQREAQVIANVIAANRGPLDEEAIRRLFGRVIEEVRRIEKIESEKK